MVIDNAHLHSTHSGNPLMAAVHNIKKRMPCILSDDLAREWIMDGLSEERITEIASYQYPAEKMQAYTIEKTFRTSDDPMRAFTYADLPPLEV
jgi:putative SOS response-associated peptidase YedK